MFTMGCAAGGADSAHVEAANSAANTAAKYIFNKVSPSHNTGAWRQFLPAPRLRLAPAAGAKGPQHIDRTSGIDAGLRNQRRDVRPVRLPRLWKAIITSFDSC